MWDLGGLSSLVPVCMHACMSVCVYKGEEIEVEEIEEEEGGLFYFVLFFF